MPLCSVTDAFLPFSGFLDFSEGYLSFQCVTMEPVKVLDVTKVAHPHPIMLPGIQPMMKNIAVSSRALFVSAAGNGGYFLWKRKETQPTVYDVFVKFEGSQKVVIDRLHDNFDFFDCKCFFSSDSKLAIAHFLSVLPKNSYFLIIDVDSGKSTRLSIDDIKFHPLSVVLKTFCTGTVMLHLEYFRIQIFDLKKGKRLESSFQRYLTEDLLIHSKLSPKGTVLAVPRLTGDMVFFELLIPKQSSVSGGQ